MLHQSIAIPKGSISDMENETDVDEVSQKDKVSQRSRVLPAKRRYIYGIAHYG